MNFKHQHPPRSSHGREFQPGYGSKPSNEPAEFESPPSPIRIRRFWESQWRKMIPGALLLFLGGWLMIDSATPPAYPGDLTYDPIALGFGALLALGGAAFPPVLYLLFRRRSRRERAILGDAVPRDQPAE